MKNKYSASRTHGFDSKLEAAVYNNLLWLEKAGEIKDIKLQDCVELTEAKIRCKIDFSFTDCRTDKRKYCEAKGFNTERWLIIKKLWKFYAPGDLEIWGGNYGRPFLIEVIVIK